MLTTRERALFSRVADELRRHQFRCWYFGDSIGFEGLLAASELLADPTWADFSHGFFRSWATRRMPFRPADNTAPGLAICEVADRTDDAVLRVAVIALGEYLYAGRRRVRGISVTFEDSLEALREPYGDVALSPDDRALMAAPGAGIWLDCMHFDAPFYARLGSIGAGGDWARRAVEEILAYGALLFDKELGLYRHYWLERTGGSYIRGWGRGQGWGLLGLLDVVEHAEKATPRYGEVVDRARTVAEAMRSFQLADGNWWAMVHEPESGPEASTAAFMATAFYRGMALGVLPTAEFGDAADRAYAAMIANLDDAGHLRGVSAAVHAALVQQHYWRVPRGNIVPWGQGPVLTAALARQRAL